MHVKFQVHQIKGIKMRIQDYFHKISKYFVDIFPLISIFIEIEAT
jgi:hypothetical protein